MHDNYKIHVSVWYSSMHCHVLMKGGGELQKFPGDLLLPRFTF